MLQKVTQEKSVSPSTWRSVCRETWISNCIVLRDIRCACFMYQKNVIKALPRCQHPPRRRMFLFRCYFRLSGPSFAESTIFDAMRGRAGMRVSDACVECIISTTFARPRSIFLFRLFISLELRLLRHLRRMAVSIVIYDTSTCTMYILAEPKRMNEDDGRKEFTRIPSRAWRAN